MEPAKQIYTCDLCRKSFDTEIRFKNHKKGRNCNKSSDVAWECVICQNTFTTKNLLSAHMNTHIIQIDSACIFDEMQNLYFCEVCAAEFQVKDEALNHSKVHTLSCGTCKKKFCSPYDLGIHSREHNNEDIFTCPLCPFSVKEKRHFGKHVHRIHLNDFSMQCKICGKEFFVYKRFRLHQHTHSLQKSFVTCLICKNIYFSEKRLLMHQIAIHDVKILRPDDLRKPIKDKSKKRKYDYKDRTFLCNYCGRVFAQNITLQEHVRVHTGENPYVCSQCGKGFKKKGSLQEHERVHTGEKPFSCEFCGKCFARRAAFRVHKRTHTGERPYKCPFCNKGYFKNQDLKIHKRTCGDARLMGFAKYDDHLYP